MVRRWKQNPPSSPERDVELLEGVRGRDRGFVSVSTDSGLDQSELVAELLKELSNHNERIEERKAALCELLKLIRENTLQVWDEHFKTILLLLLETMGDREVSASPPRPPPLLETTPFRLTGPLSFPQHVIRTLALRVLREILNKQPGRFKNYAELTIMKALEAHKDPHKEVCEHSPPTVSTGRNPF